MALGCGHNWWRHGVMCHANTSRNAILQPYQRDHRSRAYVLQREHEAHGELEPQGTTRDHYQQLIHRRNLLVMMASFVPAAQYAEQAHSMSSSRLRYMTDDEYRIVMDAMNRCIPPIKCPLMLRLVFHDSATYRVSTDDGGPNGSIQFETDRPENFGLKRGVNVIRQLQEEVKGTPLSFADLIALSGAYAVYRTNGPNMIRKIRIGRKDATAPDPEGRMPEETFSAPEQLAAFESMGFGPTDMVALLGSHTLGNKGFGEPLLFDNTYYTSLLKKPWENSKDPMASMIGLQSDRVLPDDATLRPIIQRFADDNDEFLHNFTRSYIQLTELGYS